MNIVENEAVDFFELFYNTGKINDVAHLKSNLKSKLYLFERDRDKLDFLKILQQKTVEDKKDHETTCNEINCHYSKDRETGLFVIKQEIESINRDYQYEPTNEDQFTPEEESELHCKLNDIMEILRNLGLGQEIIFEEIESLKNHFNLGKKKLVTIIKR